MRSDYLMHLKKGVPAAAFGASLGGAIGGSMGVLIGLPVLQLAVLVLICCGAGALIAGASAGITKEVADMLDNQIQPGMHGVDPLDAAFTTAPGAVACMALCTLAYLLAIGSAEWLEQVLGLSRAAGL